MIDISKELNIGLDCIVFVDDSDFEFNLINSLLPEVHTLDLVLELYQYIEELMQLKLHFINDDNITLEDKIKSRYYKEQEERKIFSNNFNNIDYYLTSLKIKLIFEENKNENIPRISQLTLKTNQFNLTIKRYEEIEIEKINKDNLIL